MKGLLGREELSFPIDPYATRLRIEFLRCRYWLRNFVQISQPSASLRGGICLKIAPLSLQNSILRLRLGAGAGVNRSRLDNLRLGHAFL